MRALVRAATVFSLGTCLLAAAPAAALFLEDGGDGGSIEAGKPLVVVMDHVADAMASFVFVVDGVDVTAFARADGSRRVIELPMKLEPGSHTLVAISNGGREQTIVFQVHEKPYYVELAGAVDGQGSYRVQDNQIPHPPELDRGEGSGAIQVRSEFERGPLSGSIYAPLLYDSGGKERGLGRHWDLADFLGTVRLGPFSAQIGQHGAARPSLILQGFHRRGISVRADGPVGSYASGFIYRTEPITGFRERFGIDDRRNRLTGATLGTDHFSLGEIGDMSLALTWLTATGGEAGVSTAGVGFDPGTEHGHAMDGAAEVRLFDGGLMLGGEWARSRFDFDGGGGASSIVGHAWQVYGEAAPLRGVEVLGHPLDARLFYQESETDPFFRSLGNSGSPVDLHRWNSRFDLSWAGFAFSGSYARLEDNIDDEEDLTTRRDESWSFDGSYTPVLRDDPWWRKYFGIPTIQAGWSRYRSKPIANEPPPIFVFDGMFNIIDIIPVPVSNRTTRTLYVAVQTSFERWSIGGSYTDRRFDETSSPFEDQASKSISGHFQWRIHERLSLQINGSREVGRFRDPAFKSTSKRLGASIFHQILPGRLDGTLRVDWQQSQNSFRTSDRRDWLASAETSWHAIQPQGNRPGLSFAVLGLYQAAIDEVTRMNSVDAYQVFGRVTLVWSPRGTWGQPSQSRQGRGY